jgi:hydrogenase maturation factor
MSRRLNLDPIAVASSGVVLVNVAHFDGPRRAERLLDLARSQRGRLFVGVELSPAETSAVLEQVQAGHRESAAYVIGRRQRRFRYQMS